MDRPRRSLAFALAATFLAVPFAGCIGGAEPAPPPPEEVEPNVVVDPCSTPDGRTLAACRETNRTEEGLGGMAHEHDYWLGRDRVDIMSGYYWMIPFPLVPGEGYTPGTAIVDWQPPPPNLVYEGTEHIEFLIHDVAVEGLSAPDRETCVRATGVCSPVPPPRAAHPNAHFRLKYITPKEVPGEWRDAGPVTVGQPLIIPVAHDEVDMPHATASLWVFRLYTDEPNSVSFNMTITAVRGKDVVHWPGHPDFYADRATRVVMDADTQTKAFGAAQFVVTGDDTTWNHPEKLISYGTERLDVFVNITRVDSPVEPTGYFLDYHNATVVPGIQTFDPGQNRVYDAASDGTSFHFVVPVDDGGMDSPYMVSSRWGFRVLAEFSNEVVQGCGNRDIAGESIGTSCFPYTVDYHMTIVATGRSEALGAENMTAAAAT